MADAKPPKGVELKPEMLSAGALTYCYEAAREFVYQYKPELNTKAILKGREVEDEAIQLYNDVMFKDAKKNTIRLSDELFTGEADIVLLDRGVDIKCAWSFESFHATKERLLAECKKAGYDWQCRAYMMLFEKPVWDIANCLVNTPDHLIGYEDESMHVFDHIPDELRITTITYRRDLVLEKLMRIKAEAAQKQIELYIEMITNDHK